MEGCVTVGMQELSENAWKYMSAKCGLDRESRGARMHKEKAVEIWERYFSSQKMDIYIQTFAEKSIEKGYFLFDETKIPCNILKIIEKGDICGGYQYLFHAPLVKTEENELSLMQQFFVESWQSAILDAGRDYLQAYLQKQIDATSEMKQYVSPSFGPGFFGMDIEAVRALYQIMHGEDTGIIVNEYGMMEPLKSIIGMHLVLKKEVPFPTRDCASCLSSQRGCEFCKGKVG